MITVSQCPDKISITFVVTIRAKIKSKGIMQKFRLLLSARNLCARAGFCSSVEEVSSFDTRAHIKISVPPTPKVAAIPMIAVVTTVVVVTVIMLI